MVAVFGSSSFTNWWLRSANSSNDTNFRNVNNNGNVNNNNANNSNGVCLGSSPQRGKVIRCKRMKSVHWREGDPDPPVMGK